MSVEAIQGSLEQVVEVNNRITEWDEHFTMERFQQFLEGKEALITIGYVEGKAVGFMVGYLENDVYKRWVTRVDPDHRGKGVFRSMHAYTEEWAISKGAIKVFSDVAFRRETMVKSNFSVGFHVVGFDFIDDFANSRIFFEKDLVNDSQQNEK